MTPYRKWDIILVPFPFTDLTTVKKRPALIVSPDSYKKSGQDVVIAFLTSRMDVSPCFGIIGFDSGKSRDCPKPRSCA